MTWLYMLRPLTQGTCAEHQVARAESTGPGIGHHDAHRAMDAVDGGFAAKPHSLHDLFKKAKKIIRSCFIAQVELDVRKQVHF